MNRSVAPLIPKRSRTNLAFPLASLLFCLMAIAPIAWPQNGDPNAIRVESNEVLVPVLVLDKARLAGLRAMNPYLLNQELQFRDFTSWEQLAVRGLTAADFTVFEDGQEQLVRRASVKPQNGPPLLRDNLGYFWDFLGVGGGIWTVPLSSVVSVANVNLPQLPGYLVGYIPPPSPSGSCHRITVKIKRPEMLVYSRREYCDTQISAADPLNGTKIGKKLASDLTSRNKGSITLSLGAFAPLTTAATIPVQIYLDFPSKPLIAGGNACGQEVSGKIVVMGAIYTDAGEVAARFSDFASRATDSDHSFGPLMALMPHVPGTSCMYDQPGRYRTEVALPPGSYEIRVALREGRAFGRAEIPLAVEKTAAGQLALSGIALVRRFRDLAADSQGTTTALPENLVPLLAKSLEVTPTGDTRFRAGDPFYFYLQVYQPLNSGASPHAIKVAMRILDAKTRALVRQIEPVNADSRATPGDPLIPIAGGINIANLRKGSYQIQAQAIDSAGATTPWRSTNFTIE